MQITYFVKQLFVYNYRSNMCTSQTKEDQINELCQNAAQDHCTKLLDSITEQSEETEIDASILRTAFLAYIDTFQNVFRSEINKRFDNVMNSNSEDQEPWFTDYVTLKPLNHEESKTSGNSIVAKAQKITKKACVLLQSHSENNTSNNIEESLTG